MEPRGNALAMLCMQGSEGYRGTPQLSSAAAVAAAASGSCLALLNVRASPPFSTCIHRFPLCFALNAA